jgi:hypothetical protein
MNLILITVIIAIISWIILGGIFLAYPTVQRIKEYKDEISLFMKIPVYVWLIIGLTADFAFNATWGTAIFREVPREMTFTARLQRHWRSNDTKQKKRAEKWVRYVNLIDPGHV